MAKQEGLFGTLPLPTGVRFLPRPHLLARLRESLGYKLTLITAEAGYGKTTLLGQFTREADLPTVYYSLHKSHQDPVTFLNDLVQGLWRLFPDFRAEALASLARAPDPEDTDSFQSLLIAVLRSCISSATITARDALLILDDYQELQGSEMINRLVEVLVEERPTSLHLFIASRGEPALPLARWRARGEIYELTTPNLRFTPDEVAELFATVYGLPLEVAQVEYLTALTEGWIAALYLVQRVWQCLPPTQRARALEEYGHALVTPIYEFLAEEVLRREPPETVAFLLKTSILVSLLPPICDALLGITNAQSILSYLETSGIFIYPVSGKQALYRYHHLFRDFLRERLWRQEGEVTVHSLHARAGEIYAGKGEWDLAVHHYTAAGELTQASELIETEAPRLLGDNRYETVVHWITSLPLSFLPTRPWLLLYLGQGYRWQDNLTGAAQALEQAQRLFSQQGDRRGESWSLSELGVVKYHERRYSEAIAFLQRALTGAAGEPTLCAELLLSLGLNYAGAGDLPQAASHLEAALEGFKQAEERRRRVVGEMRTWRNLAVIYDHQGRHRQALVAAQKAQEIGQREELGKRAAAWNLNVLGNIYLAGGDVEMALKALAAGRALVEGQRTMIWQWLVYSQGKAYAALQDYARAAEHYRLADAADISLALLNQEFSQALEAARREEQRYADDESPYTRARCQATVGIVYLAMRDYVQARPCLGKAAAVFARLGYRQRLAAVQLHLARLAFCQGDAATERRLLREALAFAAAEGYYHFDWWHPETIAFLCAEALKANLYPEYVVALAVRRIQPAQASFFLPLLSHPDVTLRARGKHILQGIGLDLAAEVEQQGRELLAACPDDEAAIRLAQLAEAGWLTWEGIGQLRARGLTWREIEVFAHYVQPSPEEETPRRMAIAAVLYLSEKTVRQHISAIRRKLGLPLEQRGSALAYHWALRQGIVPPPKMRDSGIAAGK